MNRLCKYLLAVGSFAALSSAMTSCADDIFEPTVSIPENTDDIILNADGTMTMTVNMEIPDMESVISRAGLSDEPNYGELSLYLLTYEPDGLKQFTKIEQQIKDADVVHGHNAMIKFRVDLSPTEKNAVAHLIATNDPSFESQLNYYPEDQMIPMFATTYPYEAYWQRIDFGCNIPSAEQVDPTQEGYYTQQAANNAKKIRDMLAHVAMIRNFCRVSINADQKVTDIDHFHLTGLYVLNTVNRGTIVPYVSSNDVGNRFVNYYKEPTAEGEPYIPMSYQEVSAQGHVGTLPSDLELMNDDRSHESNIDAKSEDPDGNLQPVYFYERPGREIEKNRTFVIIRGDFDDNSKFVDSFGKGEKNRFFKIDLGNVIDGDIVGRFEYYNLLRNFDYQIKLHSVDGDGYETFKEACNGVVFNNFSASIEARNMYSISDGDDMMFVNHTSFVFTEEDEEIEVLAQFREQVANAGGGVERNDLIKYLFEPEIGPDQVVTSINYTANHDASGTSLDKWNSYKLKGSKPTNELRTQLLYIYRGNKAAPGQPVDYGLYRTITLYSHVPWTFENMDIVPGLYHSIDEIPNFEWHNEQTREVGQGRGSGLTIFFELPAGLPEAIFPLEFAIEADRQNVQNAYSGQCYVRSVSNEESLFYNDPTPAIGSTETSRIQYIRTVTWEDYNTAVVNGIASNGNRIVDCQFLTITDLDEAKIGDTAGKSKTIMRVYNKYFGRWDENRGWIKYHEDDFYRDQNTPDPTPSMWDFQTEDWMYNYRNTINDSWRENFTDRSFANLRLTEGGTRSISHFKRTFTKLTKRGKDDGEVELGFLRLGNDGDVVKYNVTYKAGAVKAGTTAILEISSCEPNAEGYYVGLKPEVTFTGGAASYIVTEKNDPNVKHDNDKRPRRVYVYTISLNEGATSLGIEVRRPTGKRMYIHTMSFWPDGQKSY